MSKKDTTYILNEIRNYLDEFNNASDDYYSFIKLSKELTELRTTIQRIELTDASIPYINQLKKQYDTKGTSLHRTIQVYKTRFNFIVVWN